jgi:uncharacterized membrane protein (UPF0127 family)
MPCLFDGRMLRSGAMRRAALVFAALLTLTSVGGATPVVIPLKMPSGQVLKAEVMVEDADRARGLMFRESLPEDRAMVFVFGGVDFHGIWMKNCKFPIDILWLDETQKVVHLAEAVPPCAKDPCPTYQPMQRAAYVIELNARQARKLKATVGSRVEFSLP